MRDASAELKIEMNTRSDFYLTAHIEFANGLEKDFTKNDFYLSGSGFYETAGSNSFPLGIAVSKQLTMSIVNDVDQFSTYDFYLSKLQVYCNMDLQNRTEVIPIGTFTVNNPEAYGTTITVTAVDDMYKGDKSYSTMLNFPMTAAEAMRDSCSTCGVYLASTTFPNDDYEINMVPEGITHRELWGMCAMLAGGNARMDGYNRLEIISYGFSGFEQREGLDGGYFDEDNPYSSGDNADGGTFKPWTTGKVIDGGYFSDQDEIHVFSKLKNLVIATDDVVITGVKTTIDKTEYLFGNEGYVLKVENKLIEENPEEAIKRIGVLLVGARFRPFSCDTVSYPLAEFGDLCYVKDRKNNLYRSVITDMDFEFYGFTTIKCTAESPLRNSSEYYSKLAEAVVQTKKNTEKQITEYDKAVQMLTSMITLSFGIFKTEEVLEDGSIIFYQHDKPTLEESKTIWKKTADAFAVSADGGKTWNAGIDSSGNAVVNVLSAIGINCDWIRAGILTLGGQNNTNGHIRILDASGKQIGSWGKDGIVASKGTFSGSLSGATGTFKGSLQAASGTFSGDLSAAGGTFNGDFSVNGFSDDKYPIKLKNATGAYFGVGGTGFLLAKGGFYIKLDYDKTASMPRLYGGIYSSINEETFAMSGEDSNLYLDADGMFKSIWTRRHKTDDVANIHISSEGYFYRVSSSSRRYKMGETTDLGEIDPRLLYNLPVKVFRYVNGYLADNDPAIGKNILGLIAEDVAKIFPWAASYENGRPETWKDRTMIPAMLWLIQDQHKQLLSQEAKMSGLEDRVGRLESMMEGKG